MANRFTKTGNLEFTYEGHRFLLAQLADGKLRINENVYHGVPLAARRVADRALLRAVDAVEAHTGTTPEQVWMKW